MQPLTNAKTAHYRLPQRGGLTSMASFDCKASYDPKADYVLGRSEAETKRLQIQANILGPVTERMLALVGIASGMRVLDLGCGTGDVTLLAARLVGPSGSVIGIDHDKNVLASARKRVETAGFANVDLRETSIESFQDAGLFDVVIGRLILFHQREPVAFLKSAARHVRQGGFLAFQELAPLRGQFSFPAIPEYERACRAVGDGFKAGVPNDDVALCMAQHFSSAGLPEPELLCETPIGAGARSPLYAWVAETFHSLTPLGRKHGIAGFQELATESLETRLREAAAKQHSQVTFATSISAWTQVGPAGHHPNVHPRSVNVAV